MKTHDTSQYRPLPSRRNRYLGVALLALLASSCGSGSRQAAPAPPSEAPGATIAEDWNTLLEKQISRDDLSDFEREVLQRAQASGSISVEDYHASWDRYKQCIAPMEYNLEYTVLPNDLVRQVLIIPEDLSEEDANEYLEEYKVADDRCATGTVKVIESLFLPQAGNPDLLANPAEVAATCLADAGLVGDDYTAEDFDHDLGTGFSDADFDVMSLEAQACIAGAGMAIDIGE